MERENMSKPIDGQHILDYRGVEHEDIPNIDIYMDQLLTFF